MSCVRNFTLAALRQTTSRNSRASARPPDGSGSWATTKAGASSPRRSSKTGMDFSGIEIVEGGRSSQTWIPVDAQGERCIYMFPNVSGEISAALVRGRFAEHIRNANTSIPKHRSSRSRRQRRR